MTKQLSITIPDDLYERLRKLKKEMTGTEGKRKISYVCKKAIEEILEEADACAIYRKEGIKDGKRVAASLPEEDKEYISRILSKDKDAPYRKWSELNKIEKLKTYFIERKKVDIEQLLPKFIMIMDQELPPLHPLLETIDEQIDEDRIAEAAWYYTAGCFEGINEMHIKRKGG